MSDKVWVLSIGEYSDRSIVGIFSTRETLDAALAGADSLFNEPEEYTLDELTGKVPTRYRAAISLRSGEVFDVGPVASPDFVLPGGCKVSAPFRYCWNGREAIDDPYLRVESPESEEHAVKVAVEKRQEWLRNGGTITPDAGGEG